MSDKFEAWFRSDKRDISVLAGWCQGLGGIPYSPTEEPYLWILAAMPSGPEEAQARAALALSAGKVIRALIDGKSFGSDHEQLWYNLLKLCSGLNSPDELYRPLRAVFEWRKLPEYHGVPIWDILLDALAFNQLNNELEGYWAGLIRNPGPTPRFLAFNGCVMMPSSGAPGDRGRPYVDRIGFALKWMAHDLEERRDRRFEFGHLIQEVKDTYPGWVSFDKDILRQADRHRWPKWAVECAPSLYELKENGRAILWKDIALTLPDSCDLEDKKSLCDGVVLDVRLNGARDYVSRVAPVLERFRIAEEASSEGAMHGAVLDGLMRAEQSGAADPKLIREGRRNYLRHQKIAAQWFTVPQHPQPALEFQT